MKPRKSVSHSNEWLVRAFNARGLSQNQIAKQTGLSQSAISQLLSGKTRLSQGNIDKIAIALGTTPLYLRSGKGSCNAGLASVEKMIIDLSNGSVPPYLDPSKRLISDEPDPLNSKIPSIVDSTGQGEINTMGDLITVYAAIEYLKENPAISDYLKTKAEFLSLGLRNRYGFLSDPIRTLSSHVKGQKRSQTVEAKQDEAALYGEGTTISLLGRHFMKINKAAIEAEKMRTHQHKPISVEAARSQMKVKVLQRASKLAGKVNK